MFKIGDRVKCINAGDMSNGKLSLTKLVLHREYIIYNIMKCKCGLVKLDVGIEEDRYTKCNCGVFIKDSIGWCNAYRFIKVQDKKEYIAVQSNVEFKEEELQLN